MKYASRLVMTIALLGAMLYAMGKVLLICLLSTAVAILATWNE